MHHETCLYVQYEALSFVEGGRAREASFTYTDEVYVTFATEPEWIPPSMFWLERRHCAVSHCLTADTHAHMPSQNIACDEMDTTQKSG